MRLNSFTIVYGLVVAVGLRVHKQAITLSERFPNLWIEQVRVYDGALYVIEVGVMLKCALQQSCLFTQLRYMRTIIMREHLISQNSISNLKHRKTTGMSRFGWKKNCRV